MADGPLSRDIYPRKTRADLGHLHGLVDSALDYISLLPKFESQREAYLKGILSLTSLHYLWRSQAHLDYHVHESGIKITIIIIKHTRRPELSLRSGAVQHLSSNPISSCKLFTHRATHAKESLFRARNNRI